MKLKISILVILLIAITISAPARHVPVYNSETKECAMYWAGDEFVGYELPEEWKLSETDYETKGYYFEIDELKCIDSFEECCERAGYTTIVGNVGEYETTTKDYLELITTIIPMLLTMIIIPIGILTIIYLKWKKKRVTDYINKKAIIIGTIIGIISFYISINLLTISNFGATTTYRAIVFLANIICYGTISCIIATIIKKLRKR